MAFGCSNVEWSALTETLLDVAIDSIVQEEFANAVVAVSGKPEVCSYLQSFFLYIGYES